jgi:hypothetical protein
LPDSRARLCTRDRSAFGSSAAIFQSDEAPPARISSTTDRTAARPLLAIPLHDCRLLAAISANRSAETRRPPRTAPRAFAAANAALAHLKMMQLPFWGDVSSTLDAKQRASSPGRHGSRWRPQTQQGRLRGDGPRLISQLQTAANFRRLRRFNNQSDKPPEMSYRYLRFKATPRDDLPLW